MIPFGCMRIQSHGNSILRGEPKWHEKMAETNMGQKANQKHS
jgi:hypothetical protein